MRQFRTITNAISRPIRLAQAATPPPDGKALQAQLQALVAAAQQDATARETLAKVAALLAPAASPGKPAAPATPTQVSTRLGTIVLSKSEVQACRETGARLQDYALTKQRRQAAKGGAR